jgi:integrase
MQMGGIGTERRRGNQKIRFHELRHTWASWHVQEGTPSLVRKELGGWETIEMVQKYAHLGRSHLAAHQTTSRSRHKLSSCPP